jgi:hypothetical protein
VAALILAVGLSAIAIVPLLSPGFFHNHAGLLPAYQAAAVGPFGWGAIPGLPALGPLAHVALALLQLVGLQPVGAIKALHGVALLLGPAGAFIAGTALWRLVRTDRPADAWQGGVIAAVVFAFVPVRLAATYIRGDLSEALALALLPWLAALALTTAPSVALAGVMVTLTLAQPLLAVGGAFAALVLRWAAGARALPGLALATAAGLAVGLGAWLPIWRAALPATPEPVQPADLLLARWSYGSTPADGLPVQLGVVAVGGGLIALLAGRLPRPVALPLAALAIVPALACLVAPIWGPFVAFVGQSWLLLGLSALGFALLTSLLPLPADRDGIATVVATALVALVAAYNLLQPIPLAALSRGEPVLAVFGDRIALLDLVRGASADQRSITVDWQALADGHEDYRVWLRVLDATDRPVAEREHVPLDGVRPTGGWVKGEVIRDQIALPDGLAPGAYRIAVGLVRSNGERLPVRDRTGRTDVAVPLGEVFLR